MTLSPLADRHAAADLTAAADVAGDAVETLGAELLLVDLPEGHLRPTVRRSRRRRPW